MTTSRVFNIIFALLFLLLTLAFPVRGLLFPRDVAADLAARGTPVFNPENANSAAQTTHYILLALFGSLTLVFSRRALKPAKPKPQSEPQA